MTEPTQSYGGNRWWDNFGEYGFLTRLRAEQLRDVGACLSPMIAFLLLQGLETLPQRMREQVANAMTVAQWLDADPRVSWVRYAGLPQHPHADRARRYLPKGPGAVFSFSVVGGRRAGQRFIEAVELCSHLANIGDAKTLVIHPASTTHQQLSDAQLEAGGVPPDLVRISVGIEDAQDILWDLDQALPQQQRRPPRLGPKLGAAVSTHAWSPPSAAERLKILQSTRTVASVGASDNPARASYFVATNLLTSSPYRVWFVNPRAESILGQQVYPCLADLPESPDLVDVFRKPSDLLQVLGHARDAGAATLWLQLGLWDPDVAADAETAGLAVVMDRCLKIEHARFHGGLHLAGFDTGVISSRRRGG